jgi:hypothetical protein
MTYRVTFGGVISADYCTASEARDVAMAEAQVLTGLCGFPVEATVHRLGHDTVDGRPAFLLGRATPDAWVAA